MVINTRNELGQFIKWHKSVGFSDTTGKKISEALKWKKKPPRSDTHKKNMSIAKTGKKLPHTKEWNLKIWDGNRWKKHPEMGKARMGDKNPAWKWRSDEEKTEKRHLSEKKRIEKKAWREKSEQCEICWAIDVICYDHDHATGEFRWWICRRCNFALWLVKDNIEILEEMIVYLKNWLPKTP